MMMTTGQLFLWMRLIVLLHAALGEYEHLLHKHVEGAADQVEELEREFAREMFFQADTEPRNNEIDAFEMFTWVSARHYCDDQGCADEDDPKDPEPDTFWCKSLCYCVRSLSNVLLLAIDVDGNHRFDFQEYIQNKVPSLEETDAAMDQWDHLDELPSDLEYVDLEEDMIEPRNYQRRGCPSFYLRSMLLLHL